MAEEQTLLEVGKYTWKDAVFVWNWHKLVFEKEAPELVIMVSRKTPQVLYYTPTRTVYILTTGPGWSEWIPRHYEACDVIGFKRTGEWEATLTLQPFGDRPGIRSEGNEFGNAPIHLVMMFNWGDGKDNAVLPEPTNYVYEENRQVA